MQPCLRQCPRVAGVATGLGCVPATTVALFGARSRADAGPRSPVRAVMGGDVPAVLGTPGSGTRCDTGCGVRVCGIPPGCSLAPLGSPAPDVRRVSGSVGACTRHKGCSPSARVTSLWLWQDPSARVSPTAWGRGPPAGASPALHPQQLRGAGIRLPLTWGEGVTPPCPQDCQALCTPAGTPRCPPRAGSGAHPGQLPRARGHCSQPTRLAGRGCASWGG